MAPSRLLQIAVMLSLTVPASAAAQDVRSMVARVEVNGQPAPEVSFAVISDGTQRRLATSGASGLAVIEFGRVPFSAGTRMATFGVSCNDRHEVLFVPGGAVLPPPDEACVRTRLGTVVWGRSDRLEIALGDAPRLASRTDEAVAQARYGFRAQAGGLVAFAGGDDLENLGSGFGGEVLLGYDLPSGLGIGFGLGLVRHSLEGSTTVDESLSRWSVIAEPRYTFGGAEQGARPYLAGRAAWQSLDADDGAGLTTESGWSYGLGAGIDFPLARGFSAGVSAHAARLAVGAEASGTDFDRSGMLYSLGVAIRY